MLFLLNLFAKCLLKFDYPVGACDIELPTNAVQVVFGATEAGCFSQENILHHLSCRNFLNDHLEVSIIIDESSDFTKIS